MFSSLTFKEFLKLVGENRNTLQERSKKNLLNNKFKYRLMMNRESVYDYFYFGFDAYKILKYKVEKGIKVKKYSFAEFKRLISKPISLSAPIS